jgi:hypothetical protein
LIINDELFRRVSCITHFQISIFQFFKFILRLVLDLGYFQIFGLKSGDEHRPLMLTSARKSSNSLMHIEFELAPINKKSDYRFLLIMEPLTIIYDAVK